MNIIALVYLNEFNILHPFHAVQILLMKMEMEPSQKKSSVKMHPRAASSRA